jgi:hypothetical protein
MKCFFTRLNIKAVNLISMELADPLAHIQEIHNFGHKI